MVTRAHSQPVEPAAAAAAQRADGFLSYLALLAALAAILYFGLGAGLFPGRLPRLISPESLAEDAGEPADETAPPPAAHRYERPS